MKDEQERSREWLVAEVKRLKEESIDMTQRDIADELGISAATVTGYSKNNFSNVSNCFTVSGVSI